MMGRGLNREGDRMMYNLGDRVRDIETGEEFSLISDKLFKVPYMASKNPLAAGQRVDRAGEFGGALRGDAWGAVGPPPPTA